MSKAKSANIVTVTSPTDGSTVRFVYEDPKQGGVKDVYFDPNKQYAVAFFRKKLDFNGKERINRLVGPYRQSIFEREGGDYWKPLFRWPEKVVEYDGRTGIVLPFYEKHFFFGPKTSLAGAEKEGYWFASAKNFNKSVPPEEKGALLGFLQVCLNLSRATKRLHAAGLAHSDLSYKNCLIDPTSGSACIIDIDGLVVPSLFPPDVVGTRDFIAPEVVATMHLRSDDKNRVLPTRSTDLHALAVLIYIYLFHRHPLRGSKFYSVDTDVQETHEMGQDALFVEHPTDASNRVRIEANDQPFLPWIDTAKNPYKIMGPYLKELFDQAFVKGLHQPNLRPTADDWENALVKTLDMIQPCSNPKCVKKWFVFDNTSKPSCPYCGTPFSGILPVLDFYSSRDGKSFRADNHRLMVFPNQYLYQWHVDRNVFPNERITDEQKKAVGYFIFHQDKWLFVNQTLQTLKDLTRDKMIPPKSYVELTEGLQLHLSNAPSGRLARVILVKA
ncbi:MAG: kinase [Deltaproteobacteria bacterium]|nr:kinase [Deltaproteobacteria bacterium]